MTDPTLEIEFSSFIQQQLIASCDKMYELAKENCCGSYLDNNSCEWYHSAWQYLRVLDKVSSPTWHFYFYYEEFYRIVTNGTNILVSGTADYSILALIYFVASKKKVSPEIWVCDICNTPLSICKTFAERNNFSISVLQGDIKTIDITQRFDIITTDAFLTRFPFAEKELIIKKWSAILSEKGKVVTTVRIEESIKQNEEIRTGSKKEIYMKEVESITTNSSLAMQIEKIKNLAGEYISHIVSIPFTSKDEIKDIFSKYGLVIQLCENVVVKGEVMPTKYFRLIADKP